MVLWDLLTLACYPLARLHCTRRSDYLGIGAGMDHKRVSHRRNVSCGLDNLRKP